MKGFVLPLFLVCSGAACTLAAAPDPLAITNVNTATSPEAVTITWTTNVPANSRISWGTSPSDLRMSQSDAAYTTSHSLTMTNLTPGTMYYVEITSVTAAGETARRSLGGSGRPPVQPAPPPPAPVPPPPPVKTSNYEEVPHFTAYFGGGFTTPLEAAGDRFNIGGNFMGGVGPRWKWFSLPVDFGYDRMSSKRYNEHLDIGGNLTVWNLTLNPTVTFNPKGRFGAYFTGGYGLYSRRTQITQVSWDGGIYCDPWWGYCWGGSYTNVLGERTTYTGGYNVGAGITFGGPRSVKFFAEARFHSMNTGNNRTEYIPVSFGARW
jgi:opacity protein-like surface antigen